MDHLLYTQSGKDFILGRAFSAEEKWIPDDMPNPVTSFGYHLPLYSDPDIQYTAIGSPFDPRGCEESFGDSPRQSERLGPDPTWRETQPSLRDALPRQFFQFKFYDFRIPHNNVEAIDISDYVRDVTAIEEQDWWHSPIYDDHGSGIVKALWEHVTASFSK